jgi:Spy/CpxP family protein refolding chaperone
MIRSTLPILFVLAAFVLAQQPGTQPLKLDPDAKELKNLWRKTPTGWSKQLKLTKEQHDKIYDVKKASFLKWYPLQKEIDAIHAQEMKDCVKILTKEQKEKLLAGLEPEKEKTDK